MKVLHLTTGRTPCGVADYAEHMVGHLEKLDIRGHVHALSIPDMKLMAPEEIQDVFREFLQLTPGFDLVHIQHEFSFFAGPDGIKRSIANFSLPSFRRSTPRVALSSTRVRAVSRFYAQGSRQPTCASSRWGARSAIRRR